MTTESTLARIAAAQPELLPEDSDPILARVLASPRILVDDPWRERRGALAHRRTLAVAGVAAIVAAGTGLGIGLSMSGTTSRSAATHPPAVRSGTQDRSGPSIKARLLVALDTASGDVVGTQSVLADGQKAERWANADNTRSVEIISGTGQWPDSENLTTWDPATGSTSLTIYPATKTWRETKQGLNGPHPIAPPSIREQVADGVYAVVATDQSVDGHNTIELSSTSDDHVTSYLWVDSTTYLPVQEASSGGTGVPTNEVDWTYLAPTAAALAKLQLTVPADYTQVSCPPSAAAPTTECPGS